MKKALVVLLILCFGIVAAPAVFAAGHMKGEAKAEEAKKEEPKAEEAKAEEAKPEIKYGINVGDNIKPVTLSSLDGSKKVDVSQLTKKTVFVMMSSVCTACRQEMLDLSSNLEQFNKRDVDLYGVVIDIDPKSAAERIGNVPFPLLGDSEYLIGKATNLMSAPSTLIVQGGKILYTKQGYNAGQWKEYLK